MFFFNVDEDVLAHKGSQRRFFFVQKLQNAPMSCSSSCCCISQGPSRCRRGFRRGGPAIALSKNVLTRSLFNCFESPNAQQRKSVQNLCARRTGDVPDMSAKSTPKPAIFVNRSGGGDGTRSDHHSHRAKFPWTSCFIILADAAQQ